MPYCNRKLYLDMYDLSVIAMYSDGKFADEISDYFEVERQAITARISRINKIYPGIFHKTAYKNGWPIERWELTDFGQFFGEEMKLTLDIIGYEHKTPAATARYKHSSDNRK